MLGIGQLSKRTGACPETIRYYEKQGMLPTPARSVGGNRLYEEHHERALTFILRARKLGFSPGEVRQLLDLMARGHPCIQVREVAGKHLEEIRQRRLDLQRMEKFLGELVNRCDKQSASEDGCPVVDKLQEPLSGN
jgi:MerR family mercuric resistance operon transcriptional regulator